MKPSSALNSAIPAALNLLKKNVGDHGKFTFQATSGGSYVVAKFDEVRAHTKPSVLSKKLGNEDAYKLKLQLYRAEKSLNLRDALFAALAKTPFTVADAEAVRKLAAKLAKQPDKGGWASGAMSWGTGQSSDAALKSAAELVDANLSAMLSPNMRREKPLPLAMVHVLQSFQRGLAPPSAPQTNMALTLAQNQNNASNTSNTSNTSVVALPNAKQPKRSMPTIATTRAEEKTEAFPTDRLGQLKRDEKVWINLRHRLFNGDQVLLDVAGQRQVDDAQRQLDRVTKEMKALGGNPHGEKALDQNPLPPWGVKDLPLIADTIRALKKRYAVEQLGLMAAARAKSAPSDMDDLMPDLRLTNVLIRYEAIQVNLEQRAARRQGHPGGTTQVPAGGGAPYGAGGIDHARATLRGRLAEAATIVRDYERGVNGITAAQCSAADATMDLIVEELLQLKQREAQEQLEALDVGTTTTTAGAPTTTTTTSTNTTTSTATAGATPSGASTTTVLPGGGNSSFRS
ncbi:MAG: hypothetical protein Q7T87_22070 [Polaromonas sp.]|nr:hypothetical protein [Polaromonas sp.]